LSPTGGRHADAKQMVAGTNRIDANEVFAGRVL
jgi:hypothetical protein